MSTKVKSNRNQHPNMDTLLMSNTVDTNSRFLHAASYSAQKHALERSKRKSVFFLAGSFLAALHPVAEASRLPSAPRS